MRAKLTLPGTEMEMEATGQLAVLCHTLLWSPDPHPPCQCLPSPPAKQFVPVALVSLSAFSHSQLVWDELTQGSYFRAT